MTKNCGACHFCGTELRPGLLPDSEWCSHCQAYRSYVSHGKRSNDVSPCLRSRMVKPITAAGEEKPETSA